jgi:hypothetical protein
MGGVKWGNELCGGATKVIDRKLDQFAQTLDFTPHTLQQYLTLGVYSFFCQQQHLV